VCAALAEPCLIHCRPAPHATRGVTESFAATFFICFAAGWFEYTTAYIAFGPISEYESEGKHVVDPYTFSLKLYKSGRGSY
jgi:hypothetical protein